MYVGVCGCICGELIWARLVWTERSTPDSLGCKATDSIQPQGSRKEPFRPLYCSRAGQAVAYLIKCSRSHWQVIRFISYFRQSCTSRMADCWWQSEKEQNVGLGGILRVYKVFCTIKCSWSVWSQVVQFRFSITFLILKTACQVIFGTRVHLHIYEFPLTL